jgi:hypothetical protein
MPTSANEHRQIVKAIASGDAEAAGRAMFNHASRSKERTIQNYLGRQAQTAAGERQTPDGSPVDVNPPQSPPDR